MISTKTDEKLLYEIKRFHSDNNVSYLLNMKYEFMCVFLKEIVRACEDVMMRIRQRSLNS